MVDQSNNVNSMGNRTNIFLSSKVIFLISFLLVSFSISAQKALDVQEFKTKYPDKQAVILIKKEEVRLTLGKNDSVEVSLNYNSEMLHLGDRTEGYAESSVYFSNFVDITNLDARTLVPHKSSYKPIKVTEFQDKTSSTGGIFYDDNKIKSFNYPGVQSGAKTMLSYSQKYKEPRLLSPFYFNSYVPVLESEITIYVDKKIKLGYRLFNNKDGKIQFTQSEDGNFNVYKWSAKGMSEYLLESNSPNISYHEPHVIYFLEEINVNGNKQIIFKNTQDLYSWYYSMAIKDQKPVGGELKSIIDSLTRGVGSVYDKTKLIFYWVQDHVKYVAFEEGYGGFIPRDANLVCDRRYGDCKDMANLLVQMLNSAGVKAYHTWIGTRDIPYSYHELPATNVDNHMIAAVKIDDNYYFLDATGRYTKLGVPTSMIQGKEALIGIDETHYEIVKVPIVDSSRNKVVDSTHCLIENNILKGHGKVSLTGYNKIDFSYNYNYTKKENQKEFIKGYSTKGSNKFNLIDYSVKNIEEKEKPILVNYNFELQDYIKTSGEELYINLNLDKPFDKNKIDTLKRKLPLEQEYKYTQQDVIDLQIPKGFKVDYLPSNLIMKTPFFEYEITYKVDGSKIIYNKKIVINTLILEKKDFHEWNKATAKLSQAYRETIVLKMAQ